MSEEILKISNLTVSYADIAVINNFSLTLSKCEKILITGPNGCGKTTLLKCILGLLQQKSGDIHRSYKNVAYCKQDSQKANFPISAAEVVKMGLFKNSENGSSRVRAAMEMTGTSELADRAFFSLSGGERQRVSLARCFCQNADLLLLDEPTSFLDAESRNILIRSMKNLPQNVSAIIVTHDSDLIENLGWRTVCLKDGEK